MVYNIHLDFIRTNEDILHKKHTFTMIINGNNADHCQGLQHDFVH